LSFFAPKYLFLTPIWASRFATFGGSRRAIRSITFAPSSAPLVRHSVATVVPLLSLSQSALRALVIRMLVSRNSHTNYELRITNYELRTTHIMKYYIISGEASGDLHASNLIKQLQIIDNQANIYAWGGDLVAATGANLRRHYRDHAIMGIWQILWKLPTIWRNFSFCHQDILAFAPDVLILIDYSGFNLRIAKWAKKQGLRVFYYISPQVWATRPKRVQTIKACVDEMFVILPFESDFYATFGYPVHYVGHPLLDAVQDFYLQQQNSPKIDFRAQYNLSADLPIIALLPGSRRQEIKSMLPTMLSISAKYNDYQLVVAAAPSFDLDYYADYLAAYPNVRIVQGQTYQLLSHAHCALVTSGTATLETALFAVPQIVCYRTSPLFYWIVRRIIRIKYISLVNLILDKAAVPEQIQSDFNIEKLNEWLMLLLPADSPTRISMLADYVELRQKLGDVGASHRAAKAMQQLLISATVREG
jgi:lipid-A-disaccharide synthase